MSDVGIMVLDDGETVTLYPYEGYYAVHVSEGRRPKRIGFVMLQGGLWGWCRSEHKPKVADFAFAASTREGAVKSLVASLKRPRAIQAAAIHVSQGQCQACGKSILWARDSQGSPVAVNNAIKVLVGGEKTVGYPIHECQ